VVFRGLVLRSHAAAGHRGRLAHTLRGGFLLPESATRNSELSRVGGPVINSSARILSCTIMSSSEVGSSDWRRSWPWATSIPHEHDGRWGTVDDFLIVNGKTSSHVCNAPSPAATVSLVIGRFIANQLPEVTVARRSRKINLASQEILSVNDLANTGQHADV
jgi:hypothetical protein